MPWYLAMLLLVSGLGGAAQAMQANDEWVMPGKDWRLVTDGVMGGVSQGVLRVENRAGRECLRLSGAVSTDNNGGFIQLVLPIDDEVARLATEFDGIRIDVSGNGEPYNVHLRTADLWLPWQSYRASFETTKQWRRIDLPFQSFEPYRTATSMAVERLKRIGIVAIGRDFEADVCVAGLAFYRRDPTGSP